MRNYKIWIELVHGNEVLDTITYTASSKWTSRAGSHVFEVLPWELKPKEKMLVWQDGILVDGLNYQTKGK